MKKKNRDLLIEMFDQTFTSKFCDTNRLYIYPSWFEAFQTSMKGLNAGQYAIQSKNVIILCETHKKIEIQTLTFK